MKDTDKKVVSTHSAIQAVMRHDGISSNTKVVLTYCLEKYQVITANGRQWDFSVASIASGTGMKARNVYNIVNDLVHHRVLRQYGCISRKTKPTLLYLFNPEALMDYLKKDNAKTETSSPDNDSADETNIDATGKPRDSAKDNAKDNAKTGTPLRRVQEKEYKKKEEDREEDNKKKEDNKEQDLATKFMSFFSGSSQPSTAVAPPSMSLAEQCDSYFNDFNGTPSKVLEEIQARPDDSPVSIRRAKLSMRRAKLSMTASAGSALSGKQSNSTGAGLGECGEKDDLSPEELDRILNM